MQRINRSSTDRENDCYQRIRHHFFIIKVYASWDDVSMRREYQMMIGQKPWDSMHRISGYLIGYYEEKNSDILILVRSPQNLVHF